MFINIADSLIDYFSITRPPISPHAVKNKDEFQIRNYPNPFTTSTIITFTLSEPACVQLIVYSLYGEEKAVLLNERILSGEHKITWEPDVAYSQIFYYCLFINDKAVIRKAISLK